jgi:hypothetical protein
MLICAPLAHAATLHAKNWFVSPLNDKCSYRTVFRAIACPTRLGGPVLGIGPVAHLHYIHNEYEAIQGFWDLNAQVGVELMSHIRF